MPNRKLELIQRLMPQVPMEYQQSIDHAMNTWWVNIRRDGGMRLTQTGYEFMHEILKLESWSLDLPDDAATFRSRVTKRTVLALDRKLEWPYYLDFNPRKKKKRIVFFGSREALMATMYGDLQQWLDSLG